MKISKGDKVIIVGSAELPTETLTLIDEIKRLQAEIAELKTQIPQKAKWS